MNKRLLEIIVIFIVLNQLLVACISDNEQNLYPEIGLRITSKENMTYFIDPVSGSDKNDGTKKELPWKTFKRLNKLILTKGNKIEILSPGTFRESLFLVGQGTSELPIILNFAQGKYNFFTQNSLKRKLHISNSNDAPDSLKAIAFYILKSKHIRVHGNDAQINFRGKAIIMSMNKCDNVIVENLKFDYERPTVSEFKVINSTKNFADIQIHKDSKYGIKDSMLVWIGDGWKHNVKDLCQEFDPKTQKVSRKHLPLSNSHFSELTKNKVRIYPNENRMLKEGLVYQNRNTFRDYAAIFMEEVKNIQWKNINIYFMHGMGFVAQFSENITYDSLIVKPNENSGRTCAAWADILHFSGCKGEIKVLNSYLSAANDDAINIHGTHLRITEKISNRKIKVRFMHPQTFGFDAFYPGDSIEFVRAKTLLPFSQNLVTIIERLNEKEMQLTLNNDVPNNIQTNDVIENISWTPKVTIRNNKIVQIPTRGILVTTRGKVIIENNEFIKPNMSGILISDDANSWFESGYVKDVTISNNKFIDCGDPVINIHPENLVIENEIPVHKNIKIVNNQFLENKSKIFSSKSTSNIIFSNNLVQSTINTKIEDLINIEACSNVDIIDNSLLINTDNYYSLK
ncbi:right-handed parallel beta-helix repeat-containing protein [Aestuariivivens sediminis]|uniref:right-handed parallel beta-helix repeat-containing protein n=1 Tax=Aestuariivivens sediminis TaxID=2913557 RepID=UPI001F5A8A9B|nr:right-handed parallel beta-helix repeat-containing protein [Aestuariivivens sediminis]